MRIISERKLREFWQEQTVSDQKRCENAMREWIKVVRLADWENFTDIRQTFNHSDIYKCCVIFDVGGNKYRIIAKVKFEFKILYIRFVLTHRQYDEKKWQADCKE